MLIASKSGIQVKIMTVGVVLVFLAGVFFVEAADRVQICHFTNSESNPTVEIVVSENALLTHLEHGDVIFDSVTGCGGSGNPDGEN